MLALLAVICYGLLVLTGGAVRLTGSGLGCPDWPSCYHHRLTAEVSFHPMIEFMNRLVSGSVTVVSAAALIAAWLRRQRRSDLVWLSGGLVIGIVAQIVLGGLVVLFKLNPYLVACHFLLTIVILADAVVLYHRSVLADERDDGRFSHVVGRDLVWLGRVVVGAFAVVTMIGTVVSGSGPHAGAPPTSGGAIRRIPIAFQSIAQLHSDFALFLIGLTLAALFAFHHARAPARAQQRLRWMFELMIVQGALGYTQYFLHDNAAVVEVHLAGVTVLWIAAVAFIVSLHAHPLRHPLATARRAAAPSKAEEPAAIASAAAAHLA
ncbi:MAG: COX15/CtaA family protein [Acidimicrobiales bacterium]